MTTIADFMYGDAFMGVLIVVVVICFLCWIWQMFFGKCPYCGSRDFVPDDGAYFYCNGCRRKF